MLRTCRSSLYSYRNILPRRAIVFQRIGDLRSSSNFKRNRYNVKDEESPRGALKLSDEEVAILRRISRMKYNLEDEIQVLKVGLDKILVARALS